MPETKTARISYWSKLKKKNVYKSIALKKFNDDIEKAHEFLKKWKEEQLEKEAKQMKDTPIKNTESDNTVVKKEEDKTEAEKVEIGETLDTTVIEEHIDEITGVKPMPIIQYTEFVLSIPELKKDACSTVIYGSSKAGKTTQMIKLIDDYFNEACVVTLLFSPNIHAQVYKPLKSDKFIKIDRWDDQIIRDIHKIQKKTKNKYTFLIVIDDCILEKLSPQILQLLLVLRNSKINTLLNLQSVTLLSRNGRNNGNNFIFRKFNNNEVITDAMKYFLGSFPPFYGLSMDQKIKLYQEATKDYNFIYLNALDGIVTFHKN